MAAPVRTTLEGFDGARLHRVPLQARSRDKVGRALAAAEALLEREGPESLTLTRVAAEAGLSVGALHQYLPDRGAIVTALSSRYHLRLEALMDGLVAAAAETADDPVGVALDGFAALYREQHGIRRLRSGLPLSGQADETVEHKQRMAERLHALLLAHGVLVEGPESATVARAMFLAADALMHEAFRLDPAGDPGALEQLRVMMRAYLDRVSGDPR